MRAGSRRDQRRAGDAAWTPATRGSASAPASSSAAGSRRASFRPTSRKPHRGRPSAAAGSRARRHRLHPAGHACRRKPTSPERRSFSKRRSAWSPHPAWTCARSAVDSCTALNLADALICSQQVPTRAGGRLRGPLDRNRREHARPRRGGDLRRRRRSGRSSRRTTMPHDMLRDPRDPRLHAQGEHARRLWIEAPGSGFTPVRITKEMIDDARVSSLIWRAASSSSTRSLACPRCCSRRSTQPASSWTRSTCSCSTRRTYESTSSSPGSSRSPGEGLQQHPALRQLLGRLDPDAARRGRARRASRTRPTGQYNSVRIWLQLGERADPLVARRRPRSPPREVSARHRLPHRVEKRVIFDPFP